MATVVDPARIFAQLQEDGWRIERTRGRHIKCLSPCGKHIVIGSGRFDGAHSDWRAVRNFLTHLKRAGWTPRA